MYAIAALPMGRLLVGALLVGLATYVALSFAAAVRDAEGNGAGLRGAVSRAADALTGVADAGLAAGSATLGARPDRRGLSRAARRWVIRLGRAGTAARGLIFIVRGAFAVRAAVQRDPGEARDVGEALTALGRRTYGPALLAALATGFVAYGVFRLARARWRRLRVG